MSSPARSQPTTSPRSWSGRRRWAPSRSPASASTAPTTRAAIRGWRWGTELPGRALWLDEVRVAGDDLFPQRLERQPAERQPAERRRARHRGQPARVFGRPERGLQVGRGAGLREQLRFAARVHRHEPPGGFVDAVAVGEDAVAGMDGDALAAETRRKARGGWGVAHRHVAEQPFANPRVCVATALHHSRSACPARAAVRPGLWA